MIDRNDILVVIPARGGSKGVPKKNIKLLDGKPLIHYSISTALQYFRPEQIIVSTDDPEIKASAESAGLTVPFLRPSELAADHSGTYEVLLHVLEATKNMGYAYTKLLLLQPTSPFRKLQHIKDIIENWDETLDMVVSVGISKQNPYFSLYEENALGLLSKSKEGNFERRQDVPPCYYYNGSMYLINVESLKKSPLHQFKRIKKYVMDELYCLDIDTPLDFAFCELVLQKELVQL
ncbi:MAG: cytidylyltransferase domain-containing protein [Chitinophagaceae bacterium]